MSRYIDADALIKWINGTGCFMDVFKRVTTEIINKQPTVDAVPVVRCSKCRMSFIADGSIEMYGAEIGKRYCSNGRKVSDDFYCADGERKDGEHDNE